MNKTKISLHISDMMCEGCEKNIRSALENLEGVIETNVSLDHKSAEIAYNPEQLDQDKIYEAIQDAGYNVDSAKQLA